MCKIINDSAKNIYKNNVHLEIYFKDLDKVHFVSFISNIVKILFQISLLREQFGEKLVTICN